MAKKATKSAKSSSPGKSAKPAPGRKPSAKVTKPAAKPTPKLASKPAQKLPPPSKPAALAKPVVKAPSGKPVPPKALASKPAPAKPALGKPAPAKPGTTKVDPKLSVGGRKGITVVTPKPQPTKKPKGKPSSGPLVVPGVAPLLGPGSATRKPLIPSGPKAAALRPLGSHSPEEEAAERPKLKTPYGKKELMHFRQLLLKKRQELAGDVKQMETEALKGQSGSLSSVPQHMADQGSDTYDQSLALDLAAADRKLIKEIDEAIKRIDNGTFGVCEMTGKPIRPERLEELPWARYSIEAARELERRAMIK